MENEIFFEAIPSTLTFLVVAVTASYVDSLVIGNPPYLFLATLTTSALSAGVGLAKCLKVTSLLR